MSAPLPFLVPAGSAESYWVGGLITRMPLTGAQTGGAFSLFELEVTPGGGVPPHMHTREDETFIVVEGEIAFWLNGEPRTVRKGEILHAPKRVPHGFSNDTTEHARMYVIATPSGMEEMFRHIGDPCEDENAPAPPVNVARLVEGCPKFGVTILPVA
jgi:quercetin dioxygenase-like cupin family protein